MFREADKIKVRTLRERVYLENIRKRIKGEGVEESMKLSVRTYLNGAIYEYVQLLLHAIATLP